MWTTSVLNRRVASGNRGDLRSYSFPMYGRFLVLGDLPRPGLFLWGATPDKDDFVPMATSSSGTFAVRIRHENLWYSWPVDLKLALSRTTPFVRGASSLRRTLPYPGQRATLGPAGMAST